MIDRRRVAMVLVLAGAGLAVVSSFLDTYGSSYTGLGSGRQMFKTSLWVVTSEVLEGRPNDAYYAAGWPVVITALAMAVAVVLMLRARTAFIGRPLVLTAAGGLAGVVLFYVLQLLHDEEMINKWPADQQYDLAFFEGTYLLLVAVVLGLAGAALAQWHHQEQPQDEEDETEVVVHQLEGDDDTPPFGMAVLSQELQEERETR